MSYRLFIASNSFQDTSYESSLEVSDGRSATANSTLRESKVAGKSEICRCISDWRKYSIAMIGQSAG